MPEALALVFIAVVSVSAYVSARLHAANPLNYQADAEQARLRYYRVSLQERLQVGQREAWEPAMLDRIFEELEITEAQLLGWSPARKTEREAASSARRFVVSARRSKILKPLDSPLPTATGHPSDNGSDSIKAAVHATGNLMKERGD